MKLSVPTAGRLAKLGFVKVTGMNSLFRHPSLPWALFKRVYTVRQAIACGGVFTSTAISGTTLGAVTIPMGESARYLARHDRLGSFAVTGSFAAKGVGRKLDAASRYTPAGENWWSQLYHTQLARLSPHFFQTGDSGIFLAVVTKALDGMVTNSSAGQIEWIATDDAPAKTAPGSVNGAVKTRGFVPGVPAQWIERGTAVGSRCPNGWAGYVDFGIEIRLGDLIASRADAWAATIDSDAARKAMTEAFSDEFGLWRANEKLNELHMLKNRAFIRQDGQVTGVAPDGNYWNSLRTDGWFVSFEDLIANGWDDARKAMANSASSATPMIPRPVATGMPVYSGFLDGTPLKAMDALIPVSVQNSGAYPNDSARPVAGFVKDASGGQVSLFTAARGVFNFPGPVSGTGVIDYAQQLADVDRLRDPLVYQETDLSPFVDDSIDAAINLPVDMGLSRQQGEARNSLSVSEMIRRAYDPLIGRVTEFDSRVQAKTVGADLGDERMTFWFSAKFPGRTPVAGPATDVVILDANA